VERLGIDLHAPSPTNLPAEVQEQVRNARCSGEEWAGTDSRPSRLK
jgi:hypothetical protein